MASPNSNCNVATVSVDGNEYLPQEQMRRTLSGGGRGGVAGSDAGSSPEPMYEVIEDMHADAETVTLASLAQLLKHHKPMDKTACMRAYKCDRAPGKGRLSDADRLMLDPAVAGKLLRLAPHELADDARGSAQGGKRGMARRMAEALGAWQRRPWRTVVAPHTDSEASDAGAGTPSQAGASDSGGHDGDATQDEDLGGFDDFDPQRFARHRAQLAAARQNRMVQENVYAFSG